MFFFAWGQLGGLKTEPYAGTITPLMDLQIPPCKLTRLRVWTGLPWIQPLLTEEKKSKLGVIQVCFFLPCLGRQVDRLRIAKFEKNRLAL